MSAATASPSSPCHISWEAKGFIATLSKAVVTIALIIAVMPLTGGPAAAQSLERFREQCRQQFRTVARDSGADPRPAVQRCVRQKMARGGRSQSIAQLRGQCRAQYRPPAGVPDPRLFVRQCVREKMIAAGMVPGRGRRDHAARP